MRVPEDINKTPKTRIPSKSTSEKDVIGEESEKTKEEIVKSLEETSENPVEKLGEDCAKAWEILSSLHPEITDVKIRFEEKAEERMTCNKGAYFDVSSGTHGAIILIGMEENSDQNESTPDPSNPGVILVSDLLEIKSENLSSDLAKLFTFLHEIGHALDYLEKLKVEIEQGKIKRWAKMKHSTERKLEMRRLPIPHLLPAEIKYLIENEEFETLPPQTQERIGNGEADKILEEQIKAYHELPSEEKADSFATDFIKKHFSSKL